MKKDLELLKDLWEARNPAHENEQDGDDRFWKTAHMVFEEYQKRVNKTEPIAVVSGISWTDSDVDAAYLMGVMNAGSFDNLNREVKRLSDMNIKPFEAVAKVRGK